MKLNPVSLLSPPLLKYSLLKFQTLKLLNHEKISNSVSEALQLLTVEDLEQVKNNWKNSTWGHGLWRQETKDQWSHFHQFKTWKGTSQQFDLFFTNSIGLCSIQDLKNILSNYHALKQETLMARLASLSDHIYLKEHLLSSKLTEFQKESNNATLLILSHLLDTYRPSGFLLDEVAKRLVFKDVLQVFRFLELYQEAKLAPSFSTFSAILWSGIKFIPQKQLMQLVYEVKKYDIDFQAVARLTFAKSATNPALLPFTKDMFSLMSNEERAFCSPESIEFFLFGLAHKMPNDAIQVTRDLLEFSHPSLSIDWISIMTQISKYPENAVEYYFLICASLDRKSKANGMQIILDQILSRHMYSLAEHFITQARNRDLSYKSSKNDESLIQSMVSSNQLSRAQSWLMNSFKANDRVSVRIVAIILSAYLEGMMYTEFESLLEQLPSFHLRPHREILMLNLKFFLYRGLMNECEQLAQKLQELQMLTFSETQSLLLEFYASRFDWEKCVEIWNLSNGDLTDKALAALLRLAAIRKSDLVHVVSEFVQPANHPLAITALVLIYLNLNDYKNADIWYFKALKHMATNQKLGSAKAAYISHFSRYHMVIYHRLGDFECAEKHLDDYLDIFPPHRRAFQTIIRQRIKFRYNASYIQKYISRMLALRMTLDPVIYGTLIASFSGAGAVTEAWKWYRKFLKLNIPTPYTMYPTLIVLHGKERNVDQMERLYNKVVSTPGLSSPVYSTILNALTTGYGYAGQWKKCLLIWDRLWKSPSAQFPFAQWSVQPQFFHEKTISIVSEHFGVSTVLVSIVLDALGSAKRLTEIERVWEQIISNKFPISNNCVTSYVEALVNCERYDQSFNVICSMESLYNFPPDLKTVRNFLTMLPPSRLQGFREKIAAYYPQFANIEKGEMSIIISRKKANSNDTKGLNLKQLQMAMTVSSNGRLLLSGASDLN
jgi:tetratricopeptide (TPR) repeat protein